MIRLALTAILVFATFPDLNCSIILTNQKDKELTKCGLQDGDYSNCQPMPMSTDVEPVKEGYYVSYLLKANWYQAMRYCLVHGVNLATVNSQESHDRLAAIMETHALDGLWIGATDLADEGKYFWVSDGSAARFSSWLSGEPTNSNGGENCLELRRRGDDGIGWNDQNCNVELHFACDLS